VRRFTHYLEILLIVLAIGARLLPGPRIVDDAYITFRYARNLTGGMGLVYNSGEAVLGTTSPLYALTLAASSFLGGGTQAPFPIIAWLINALADGITCWLIIRIATRLGYRNAGLATAAVWAIAPWSVTFAIGGMETSFLIALMTATLYMVVSSRPIQAALLASLCILARPDALLLVGLLVVERTRRALPEGSFNRKLERVGPWEIVAFASPLLLWTVFAQITYGSPFPHSITAKVAAYAIPGEAGLVRLMQHYATPFVAHETLGIWWIGAGLVLFPALYTSGSIASIRQRRSTWPMFLYPWVYFAVFAIANPLIFRWYLVPPLPMYFLGIFIGIESLANAARKPVLTAGFTLVFLLFSLNAWTLRPDHGPNRPAPEMAYIRLELLYEQASSRLRDDLEPGQTVAAGDIGTIGYYSNARILDTVGLISPEATTYYPLPEQAYVINYAISAQLINDLRPDHLVMLEVYGRQTLLRDSHFLDSYTLVEEIPTDMYGSDGMLIFSRQSLD
jgi:hypothetical protein